MVLSGFDGIDPGCLPDRCELEYECGGRKKTLASG